MPENIGPITARDQATRILRAGAGDPVVVLHGWGGRIESMTPVSHCLSAAFEVLAVDLPGFGAAPPPAGVWGTPEYAAFVSAVLSELGVTRAHFVGHSFGAKLALWLAATEPALVDKLVLVGSSGLRTPPGPRARAKRLVSAGARRLGAFGPPGRVLKQAIYRRIASRDYREAGELRSVLVKVVNEDLESILGDVKASTLLVWGERDDAVPLAHARTMERLIPDAGLVIFEGAGHFAYLEQPERFCRIVRHFFGAPVESAR